MIYRLFLLILLTPLIVEAAKLSDIDSKDPAYPAVKSAIDNRYFTLVDGTKFLPNQTVTRKELAIIIDRINNLNKKAELTSAEIIELKEFSTQFKSYLENQYNQKELVDSEVGFVKNEQKTINYDLSRIEENIQNIEKARKEQDVYIWLGLGLGILGVLK